MQTLLYTIKTGFHKACPNLIQVSKDLVCAGVNSKISTRSIIFNHKDAHMGTLSITAHLTQEANLQKYLLKLKEVLVLDLEPFQNLFLDSYGNLNISQEYITY